MRSIVIGLNKNHIESIAFMLTGLLVGVFDYFSFGSIYMGEVVCVFIVTVILASNKVHLLDVQLFRKTVLILLFNVFIVVQSFFLNVDSVEKTIVKYLVIYIEILLFYCLLKIKGKRVIWMVIGYISSSTSIDYLRSYSSFNFITFIHIFPFALCVLMIYSCFINDSNRNRLLICSLLVIYSIVGRSRTTLALALSLLFYFVVVILLKKRFSKVQLIFYIPILVISIISAYFLVVYFIDSISESTASNNERTLLLKIAFQEFMSNKLFGVGINQFNYYARNVLSVNLHLSNLMPHNAYVQMLAEGGLVGLILFFGPLFRLSFVALKNRSKLITFVIGIVFYYLFSIISGNMRFFYAFSLSLLLYDELLLNSENR